LYKIFNKSFKGIEMKNLFLSALLITFGLISFSQAPPDDDNDGVPNSEDACPSVKGTKANKGCPENNVNTTSFLSQELFSNIIEMVSNEKQEEYKNPQAPVENGIIQTTFPYTGINKEFPIFYSTDGKGGFTTFVILSSNESDFNNAINLIDQRIKGNENSFNSLTLREYTVNINDTKDNAVFTFGPSSITSQMLGMRIYKHNPGNNQKIIVWAIETLSEDAVNNKIKSEGIYDKVFCEEVNQILTASTTAFKNNRSSPINQKETIEYITSLPGLGLTKKHLSVRTKEDVVDDTRKTVISYYTDITFNDNEAADKKLEELVKKMDACINFLTRKIHSDPVTAKSVFISYETRYDGKLKNVNVNKLDLGFLNGKYVVVVSVSIVDEAATYKKEDDR
jgi:hypothetical protein